MQPGTGKIKSVRPRNIRAGHHEGAEIARHGRSDQSPKPGHRALPRADHQVVMALEDHGERERAMEVFKRLGHRLFGRHPVIEEAGNQLRRNLRIRFRFKDITLFAQPLRQFPIILDNAVMDERDLLGHMRMGVDLVRYAMGRPAGMANPGKTGKRRHHILFAENPDNSTHISRTL